jgi:hypothetical protein
LRRKDIDRFLEKFDEYKREKKRAQSVDGKQPADAKLDHAVAIITAAGSHVERPIGAATGF